MSDRIYRIIWIEGPSAQGYLAAGEKIFTQLNFEEQDSLFSQGHDPVNPVKKKENKDRIHSTLSILS